MIDMSAMRKTSYIISILRNVQILGLFVSDICYSKKDIKYKGFGGFQALLPGFWVQIHHLSNQSLMSTSRHTLKNGEKNLKT